MNQRKFRIIDSKLIHENLSLALQFKNKIEETCIANGVDLSDLPNSVLPSNVLYEITLSYCMMYDKLLEEELIYSSNNHKININTH